MASHWLAAIALVAACGRGASQLPDSDSPEWQHVLLLARPMVARGSPVELEAALRAASAAGWDDSPRDYTGAEDVIAALRRWRDADGGITPVEREADFPTRIQYVHMADGVLASSADPHDVALVVRLGERLVKEGANVFDAMMGFAILARAHDVRGVPRDRDLLRLGAVRAVAAEAVWMRHASARAKPPTGMLVIDSVVAALTAALRGVEPGDVDALQKALAAQGDHVPASLREFVAAAITVAASSN